jgi:preprotein translocase subunit SecG
MNLKTIFLIVQVVISVLLITAVLLQNRGAGLGQSFGGSSSTYHTKRGFEKRLHQATIILAIAFLTIPLLQIIL